MEIQETKQVIHDTSVSQDHSKLKEYALRYASELGLRVHPLHDAGKPNAKEPRLAEWQLKATNDVKQIEKWWEQWPDANIGIATGGDGVDVLDLDSAEAIALLLDKALERQTTPLAKSSKGYHVYFRAGGLKNGVNVLKNGNNIFPAVKGVDLRGDRGYIVAPPSIHPSGAIYQWQDDPFKMAFAPLPDLVKNLKSRDEPVKIQFDMPANTNVSDAQRSGYAEKTIEGIKEDMRNLIGGGRNQTLNNCVFRVGQLFAGGALDNAMANDALSELANIALGLPGDHPVTEREVRLTVKSAFDAGMQKPVSPEYRQDTTPTASTPTASTQAATPTQDEPKKTKRQRIRDALATYDYDTFTDTLRDARDGQHIDIDSLTSDICMRMNDVSRALVKDEIFNIKHHERRRFDSMRERAEELARSWNGVDHIGAFAASKGFDEYETVRLKKWLYGMMHRAFEPGAEFDTCLVLQGGQGCGKSKFFEYLSQTFIKTNVLEVNPRVDDKDWKIHMSKSCIARFDEIEKLTTKKVTAAQLKEVLTKRHSTERAPYEVDTKERLFRAVFCGTTNVERWMPVADEACRRFWVISVKENIYSDPATDICMLCQAAAETKNWLANRGTERRNTFTGETDKERQETKNRNTGKRQANDAVTAIVMAAENCHEGLHASVQTWSQYIATGNPFKSGILGKNAKEGINGEWTASAGKNSFYAREFAPIRVSVTEIQNILRARMGDAVPRRCLGIQSRGFKAGEILERLRPSEDAPITNGIEGIEDLDE